MKEEDDNNMIEIIKSNNTKMPIYAVTSVGIDGNLSTPIIAMSKEEGIKVFAIEIFKYVAELIENYSFSLNFEFKQLWREYEITDIKSINKILNTTEGKQKLNKLLTIMNYSNYITFICTNTGEVIKSNKIINMDDICGFMNSAIEDGVYKVFKNIRLWTADTVNIATDMVE